MLHGIISYFLCLLPKLADSLYQTMSIIKISLPNRSVNKCRKVNFCLLCVYLLYLYLTLNVVLSGINIKYFNSTCKSIMLIYPVPNEAAQQKYTDTNGETVDGSE